MTHHQPTLLDWQIAVGESRKASGMARAVARDRFGFLGAMRAHALGYLEQHGTVTIDECRDFARRIGADAPSPGVWGSVFSDPRFRDTGRTVRSVWPTSNRRKITVWELAR